MSTFLEKIEDFLSRTGMSATMLGIYALNTPNFVFNLRKGKSCTVTTMQKVLDFMETYK